MASHGCINGTLETTNSSSPMPVIGLYIAAASLVCMLLMVYDIVAGFRARKHWLPCKLFSLNSVILTLLFSIAAKLPVDLTTRMPRPLDQLSKLSGSVFICVCMAFLHPSMGLLTKPECFTNLAALTIFVLTIVTCICIQISTGVIVLFIKAHITVVIFVLFLLMMSWFAAWVINNKKTGYIEVHKEIFTKGEGSMFKRLKKSYKFGYTVNPQLSLCLDTIYCTVFTLCLICSLILIVAALKTLVVSKAHCSGVSDYDWSISVIVVTQILTVVVGNSAVMFRWLSIFTYMDMKTEKFMADDLENELYAISEIMSIWSTSGKLFRSLCLRTLLIVHFFIFMPTMYIVCWCFSCCFCCGDIEDCDDRRWKRHKAKEDAERWMDNSRRGSANHLSRLLLSSRHHPSQQSHTNTMEIRDPDYPTQHGDGVKVSSLSLVLLVRIAQVSLPNHLSESLVSAFTEASEIIHFIQETINPKSIANDKKLLLGKAVWAGRDFSSLKLPPAQSDLDRAAMILAKLETKFPSGIVKKQVRVIVEFVNRKMYTSIEDFGASIEQLFADMLHSMLAQLPCAIFKLLSDSADQEYEESVKLALKLVCKLELVDETLIQWSFPEGLGMSRMITEEARQNDVVATQEGNLVVCGEIPMDAVVIPVTVRTI